MECFVIEGGGQVGGTIRPEGNKNEALPVLAATLLSPEPVMLHNVPRILDVEVMVELLRSVGAEAEWSADGTSLRVHARDVSPAGLDREGCRHVRASILLAGPLLARCGEVTLPPPGGDVIGRRRLDVHFHGLTALGAEVSVEREFRFQTRGLEGADLFLEEASVTGTENLICAAVLARGRTVIRNAASEPHVRNLCRFLNTLGARIRGAGTNTLTIEGVAELGGGTHTIGPDYLEVGSYIGLAAATGSSLRIQGVDPEDLRMARLMFRKLGVEWEIEGADELQVLANEPPQVRTDVHHQTPHIDSNIWPGFPTDLMSIAITVATQAHGTVLFFEKMFDGRMVFVDNLIQMGARITVCDPHRIVVVGPSKLYGADLKSPDIRAGMALLIACLCAEGESVLYNVRQIDRGYRRVDEKLASIGAKISRQPAR